MILRSRIERTGLAAVFVIAAWAAPARAQDQAAQFRQMLTDLMTELSTRTGGELQARTSRPIEVRMEGGVATATLPELTISGRSPNDAFVVGDVTVTQREFAPGRMRYEAQLPREMRARGSQGEGMIRNTGSRFVMELDPRTQLAHLLELQIDGISVQPPRERGTLTIGQVRVTSSVTQRPDGLSNSPFEARIENLQFQDATSRQSVRIGQVSLSADVQGFRLEELERLRVAVNGAQGGPSPIENMRQVVDAVFGFSFATMTTDLTLVDFSFNDGVGATPALTIGRAVLQQVMSSLAQPETAYQLRYTQENVQVRAGMMPFQEYVPSEVVINLVAEKIPAQALKQVLLEALSARPGAAAMSPRLANDLVAAIYRSGATLRVAPLQWMAPAVGVTFNGSVTASEQSPLNATAVGDLVVRGLDEVIRNLTGGAPAGQPQRPGAGAGSPAAMLAMLSALGQQGTGPDGQPIRSYHIELGQDGRLTLNGTDMTALLGPLGGGRPARPPGRTPAQAPTTPAPSTPPAAPAPPPVLVPPPSPPPAQPTPPSPVTPPAVQPTPPAQPPAATPPKPPAAAPTPPPAPRPPVVTPPPPRPAPPPAATPPATPPAQGGKPPTAAPAPGGKPGTPPAATPAPPPRPAPSPPARPAPQPPGK